MSSAVLLGAIKTVTEVQTLAVAFAFPIPLTDKDKSEKSFKLTALFPERKEDGAEILICSLL